MFAVYKASADSFCVMALLPALIADQFPADGRVGEDSSPPHVTVAYMKIRPGEPPVAEAIAAVEKAVGGFAPFNADLRGLSHFEIPEHAVAVVVALGKQFAALHKAILAALRAAGFAAEQTFPEYRPHATLAYLERGAKWEGHVPSGEFEVSSLAVYQNDGQIAEVRLAGWPDDIAETVARKETAPGPSPGEHSATQAPRHSAVRPLRVHPKGLPAGVDFIVEVQPNGRIRVMAVLFDEKTWSPVAAGKWLRRHGFKETQLDAADPSAVRSVNSRGGGNPMQAVKSAIADVVAKTEGLPAESIAGIAKAFEDAAADLRKKAKLDEDAEKAKRDEEEKAKDPDDAEKAKRDEEEKAKDPDDAEKAKRDEEEKAKAKTDEEKARRDADAEKAKTDEEEKAKLDDAEKAKRDATEKAADVDWPMDMGS